MIKVSDYIVKFLKEKKVKIIFGYIGGMITHIVDSIDKCEGIDYIQVYHEQTGSFAAEGYALETKIPGVCISTSGPGVTNMITGIADAYFDSIPVVFITGQVNTYEYKWDKKIRQQGFQEMNVEKVVASITKYVKLIDDPQMIPFELEKAFSIAMNGRKGPVLLDIPMDIQRALIEEKEMTLFKTIKNKYKLSNTDICDVIKLIESSKRPLILLGGGCKDTKNEILVSFFEKYKIPFVYSLKGKGILSDANLNNVGYIGSYGNRSSNIIMAKSDLIIILGSRLSIRQTGAQIKEFTKNSKKIIHVDIDTNELEEHRIKNRKKICCTVTEFISEVSKNLISVEINKKWLDFITEIHNKYNQENEINRFVINKSPYKLMKTLNKYEAQITDYTVDIGHNQMIAAQTLCIGKFQKMHTSGGLAPMGYAIPTAIGICFGNTSKNVVAIVGDGGFHMSSQSLMLISQYNLNLKVLVLNNSSLGMITQFQKLYFNNNLVGTSEQGRYLVPNIQKMAESYNVKYYRLTEADLSNEELLNTIFINTKNCIIEYNTEKLTDVSPKLEYNKSLENMTPQLTEQELKQIYLF